MLIILSKLIQINLKYFTGSTKEILDFSIKGVLDSCSVNLNEALTGMLIVEKSERPIKSLELQLIRMESVAADESSGKRIINYYLSCLI